MDKTDSASFLSEEIDKNIIILKEKVQSQKNKTSFFNGLTIILGALITLTLGLKLTGFEEIQKNTALVLGAVLTITNGWNAIFDYKKLWVRQKSTLLDLYQLKNELMFRISNNHAEPVNTEDLFVRYQDIWERDGNEWRSIIYTQRSTSPQPTPTTQQS